MSYFVKSEAKNINPFYTNLIKKSKNNLFPNTVQKNVLH